MAQRDLQLWNVRPGISRAGRTPMGFRVYATDGEVGTVSYSTRDVDIAHIVIDPGYWIFGKRVIVPAGRVERVDWDEEKVYLDRTKEQVKNAPQLEEAISLSLAYQKELGEYYRDI